jgi:hypothetical protein
MEGLNVYMYKKETHSKFCLLFFWMEFIERFKKRPIGFISGARFFKQFKKRRKKNK